jgi:3-hydroxymyristoyl/3-hydroxydecanoyl-(acyl carrier protein) dehydratase
MQSYEGPGLTALLGITEPFLMLDGVEIDRDALTATGRKRLAEDAWFYACHFVDEPVMPGVLQAEAMLQTIVATACDHLGIGAKDCLINKSSVNFFRKIAGSGDLRVDAAVKIEQSGFITAKAALHFDGNKAADGSFRYLLPGKVKL